MNGYMYIDGKMIDVLGVICLSCWLNKLQIACVTSTKSVDMAVNLRGLGKVDLFLVIND